MRHIQPELYESRRFESICLCRLHSFGFHPQVERASYKLIVKSHTITALKSLLPLFQIILQVTAAEHVVFKSFACSWTAHKAMCNQPCFTVYTTDKLISNAPYILGLNKHFTSVQWLGTGCLKGFKRKIQHLYLFAYSFCGGCSEC